MAVDPPLRPSANQPRGTLEAMSDSLAETDQVSVGPITSRVIALMKTEHRPPIEEKAGKEPDPFADLLPESAEDKELEAEPPATQFAESIKPDWRLPTQKLDYAQMDERMKQELRYIGFLGAEEEPSYEGGWDDEVAQRIRVLQAELRRVSIENGARKAVLLERMKERMAYQEYATILEDLDQQIVQAFLKRNRTLNKPSKNKKRPGQGAGAGLAQTAGVSKPAITDVTKTLIDRRKRWINTLGGIFDEDIMKVKTKDDTLFTPEVMAKYMKLEEENWDEDPESV